MDAIINLTEPAPLSLVTLAVNLVLTLLLGSILGWFYERYGRSLSNRSRLAQVLPVLAVTTTLIISVVKSSLALSLGLVGALSIVRFRTAIKEPEELAYLFIAIAIGLGMGADQRWPTFLAISILLLFMFARTFWRPAATRNNLYLNMVTPGQENAFARVNEILARHVTAADLHRLDDSGQMLQATYLIQCPDDKILSALMDDLREGFPGSEFSFVEQESTLAG